MDNRVMLGAAVAAAVVVFAVTQLQSPQMPAGHDMSKMEQTASTAEGATKAYGAVMDNMMKSMTMTPSGIPDQDFANGMIPHHQGAIDMAKVRKQYGKDPEMLKLADAVINAQTSEIAFMHDWLSKSKLTAADAVPDSSKANSAVMSQMMKSMMMPYNGNADIDFAKGMIPHHQGAIDMAKVVLQYGKDPEIKKMAEGVVSAQEAEIAAMKQWLAVHDK
jgi:uncharacterized protein (DUF305 family)